MKQKKTKLLWSLILLALILAWLVYTRDQAPQISQVVTQETVVTDDTGSGVPIIASDDDPESHEGSLSIVDSDPDKIPDYEGEACIMLNDGIPNFNAWDIENISGEHFSEHDELGRCGTAVAMLDRSMMPTGPRGDIGEIHPTGWKQRRYDGLIDSDPPYLYNRSHLIAYALTGQNANERNLITGTRYLNYDIMRPWEEDVMDYIAGGRNHVLYRVSPLFRDDELLARGVEMEAYSVEDKGKGICYHVFIYNVQPGVELDYRTGANHLAE